MKDKFTGYLSPGVSYLNNCLRYGQRNCTGLMIFGFENEDAKYLVQKRHYERNTDCETRDTNSRVRDVFNHVLLELPESMFVLDLIRTRLNIELTRIARVSNRITIDAFCSMMRDKQILMSSSQLTSFLDCFTRNGNFGIITNSEFNAAKLLELCKYAEQGHILQVPGYKVASKTKEDIRSSAHLLRNIKNVWSSIKNSSDFLPGFYTQDEFFFCIKNEGLLFSKADSQQIWTILLSSKKTDVNNNKLSFHFLNVFFATNNEESAISNISPENHENRVRKACGANERLYGSSLDFSWLQKGDAGYEDLTNKTNDKYSERLYGDGRESGLPWERSYQSKISNDSHAATSHMSVHNPMPWMNSNTDEVLKNSNLIQRLCLRLDALDDIGFQSLLKSFYNYSNSYNGKEESNVENCLVNRRTLCDALAEADIKISKGDASIFFIQLRDSVVQIKHGVIAVTVSNIFDFLAKVDATCINDMYTKNLLVVNKELAIERTKDVISPGTILQDDIEQETQEILTDAVELVHINETPAQELEVPHISPPTVSVSTNDLCERNEYVSDPEEITNINLLKEETSNDLPHTSAQRLELRARDKNRGKNQMSSIFPDPVSYSDDVHPVTNKKENESKIKTEISSQMIEEVIDALQEKRAALALLFRKLGSSSGLVPLQEFANSLSSIIGGKLGSLIIATTGLAWKISCSMLGASYLDDSTNLNIHYNDITAFLNKIANEKSSGDQGPKMIRSLKDKCTASQSLRGEKLRLLTLTPQLRQRLRQRFLQGRQRSLSQGTSGVQDHMSIFDLIDVFSVVDVHFTQPEAKFVCQMSTEDHNMLEISTRLSAAVLFISNNCFTA